MGEQNRIPAPGFAGKRLGRRKDRAGVAAEQRRLLVKLEADDPAAVITAPTITPNEALERIVAEHLEAVDEVAMLKFDDDGNRVDDAVTVNVDGALVW
jgi:hypothetical protein